MVGQVENSTISITGLVIPVEWTPTGAVRAVALAAFNEALYHLSPGPQADRLARLVRREVTVQGTLSQKGSKQMIEVKDFSLTRSRRGTLAGLALTGMLGLSLAAGGAFAAEPVAAPQGKPAMEQAAPKPAAKSGAVKAAPKAEPKKATAKKATAKKAKKSKKSKVKKSPTVAKAQEALSAAGFAVKADGVIGPKTRAALKDYQKKQGLKATGKLDKATKKALGI